MTRQRLTASFVKAIKEYVVPPSRLAPLVGFTVSAMSSYLNGMSFGDVPRARFVEIASTIKFTDDPFEVVAQSTRAARKSDPKRAVGLLFDEPLYLELESRAKETGATVPGYVRAVLKGHLARTRES